jgi:hypothetical protein
MQCPSCTNKINNESQFCPFCGKKTALNESVSIGYEATLADRTYRSVRAKGFSYFTYKYIETDILLTSEELKISTCNNWFGIFKRPILDSSLPLGHIYKVGRVTSFSFWDTLFAVVFLLSGIFGHWSWLVLSALFFFCARGEHIEVWHTNGCTKIPVSKGDISSFDDDLNLARYNLEQT